MGMSKEIQTLRNSFYYLYIPKIYKESMIKGYDQSAGNILSYLTDRKCESTQNEHCWFIETESGSGKLKCGYCDFIINHTEIENISDFEAFEKSRKT